MLVKQQIKRQFDRAANQYDALATVQTNVADDLIELMPLSDISAGANLIDVGCGTGYALQELSERRPDMQFCGLDIAPSMLEQLAARMPHASRICADIENMPIQDQEFDVLFSSSAIQWCDLNVVFKEMARVLKPESRLYVATFIGDTLNDWRQLWMSPEEQVDHAFASQQELVEALKSAGLQLESIQCKDYQDQFHSFDDAVQSVRGLGAGRASQLREQGLMGKQRFEQIKQRVESEIRQRGHISLNYQVAFIVADL